MQDCIALRLRKIVFLSLSMWLCNNSETLTVFSRPSTEMKKISLSSHVPPLEEVKNINPQRGAGQSMKVNYQL